MTDFYKVKLWTGNRVGTIPEVDEPLFELVRRQKYFQGWNSLQEKKMPKPLRERASIVITKDSESKFNY